MLAVPYIHEFCESASQQINLQLTRLQDSIILTVANCIKDL